MGESFLERKNVGAIAKQFVCDLFLESGFDVYNTGFESFFSTLKNKIRNKEDSVSLKIRTFPDILVIKDTPILIEVKYRSFANKLDIKEKEIENYQRFWPEAFIILLISDEIGIYAQKISEIKPEGKISILEGKRIVAIDIKKNFLPITYFPEFRDIDNVILNKIRSMIPRIDNFRK